MSVHLITGHAGKGHVTALDVARFNMGIFGPDTYVMEVGDMFEAVRSGNSVTIQSGELVMKGRHVSIPEGSSEEVSIETTSGNRVDIIAMRYERSEGVETASIVVVKGESTEGNVVREPELEDGDINNGDTVLEVPLYSVYISGGNIVSVSKKFRTTPSMSTVFNAVYPVGSVYLTFNEEDPGVLFGGTWERIRDRYLYASGNIETGKTGGSRNVTITTSNMPAHTHKVKPHTHAVPKHKHSIKPHTHNGTTVVGESIKIYYINNAVTGGSKRKLGTSSSNDGFLEFKDKARKLSISSSGIMYTDPSGDMKTAVDGEHYTEPAGKGDPIYIQPEYIAVKMWKRTA